MPLTHEQIKKLASGQKFRKHDNDVYKLQKLPDFDLWILISEERGSQWVSPQKTPLGAFGESPHKFDLIPTSHLELYSECK